MIWVIKPRYYHSLFLNGLIVFDDYTQLPGFAFQFDSSPHIDGLQSLNPGADTFLCPGPSPEADVQVKQVSHHTEQLPALFEALPDLKWEVLL